MVNPAHPVRGGELSLSNAPGVHNVSTAIKINLGFIAYSPP